MGTSLRRQLSAYAAQCVGPAVQLLLAHEPDRDASVQFWVAGDCGRGVGIHMGHTARWVPALRGIDARSMSLFFAAGLRLDAAAVALLRQTLPNLRELSYTPEGGPTPAP